MIPCDLPKFLISIHAPREGSDSSGSTLWEMLLHFYPRSPRGERPDIWWVGDYSDKFLSTLPARGATRLRRTSSSAPGYFYPRSPRGERPGAGRQHPYHHRISIHAPREGSDGIYPRIHP